MVEILKTNVCCLDLSQECIDYLKSLDLNVYEGSLGSVFSINWGAKTYGSKTILIDVDYPANLHEYHVFIHDMENPHNREYKQEEHRITSVSDREQRHLECHYPVSLLDLRPFGLYRLASGLRDINNHSRIEILFVGRENQVTYFSNIVDGSEPQNLGTLSSIEPWYLVSDVEKCGQRVKLEDNKVSKLLFEGRQNNVKYYRVFSLPTEIDGEERVIDKRYLPLLSNVNGECISYAYVGSDDYVKFILPQVEDKASLLKDLFENVIFCYFSDFFPDVEARKWIYDENYLLPAEIEIKSRIKEKQAEYERVIKQLKEEEATIQEKDLFLKQLITETGDTLVKAVKTYLEWLGFENVIDKDETLKKGELKEEDLLFDYDGTHVFLEVKGINRTSTDGECSQIDKIVNRRMRQLKTTEVHGIYIVNNQKNVEPLKRTVPPFNNTQIKDAEDQGRTMVYTAQLFALYFDIEHGYITKEQARNCFMLPGLVDFHSSLTSLGVPYSYFHNDTVICLELNRVQISVGDKLFYKDEMNKLVGCQVKSIQQDKQSIESASSGKFGFEVDKKVPRNREIFK